VYSALLAQTITRKVYFNKKEKTSTNKMGMMNDREEDRNRSKE
jgi:hypothetical protein